MATTPAFANTPNLGANLSAVRISTANTARDGTGTIAKLVTGGSKGTRVDRVNIKATSSTIVGSIVFFIQDAASNTRVIHEILVTAITPAVATASFEAEWVRTDGQPVVELPSGWFLYVSTTIAQSFDVVPVISNDF